MEDDILPSQFFYSIPTITPLRPIFSHRTAAISPSSPSFTSSSEACYNIPVITPYVSSFISPSPQESSTSLTSPSSSSPTTNPLSTSILFNTDGHQGNIQAMVTNDPHHPSMATNTIHVTANLNTAPSTSSPPVSTTIPKAKPSPPSSATTAYPTTSTSPSETTTIIPVFHSESHLTSTAFSIIDPQHLSPCIQPRPATITSITDTTQIKASAPNTSSSADLRSTAFPGFNDVSMASYTGFSIAPVISSGHTAAATSQPPPKPPPNQPPTSMSSITTTITPTISGLRATLPTVFPQPPMAAAITTAETTVSSKFATTPVQDIFQGKNVVFMGLLGAFNGVCVTQHFPMTAGVPKVPLDAVLVVPQKKRIPVSTNKQLFIFSGTSSGVFHRRISLSAPPPSRCSEKERSMAVVAMEPSSSETSQWSASANWIVGEGSLHDALSYDTSAEDGAIVDPAGILLQPPELDSIPCEITVSFNSSKAYLCSVRRGAASPSSDEAITMSRDSDGTMKAPKQIVHVDSSSDEDGWSEVKLPNSPSGDDQTNILSKKFVEDTTQVHYEATAEISDASPCLFLTFHLLSLHTKASAHIGEIYIYDDPIESANLYTSVGVQGNMGGTSLWAMVVPDLMQFSKFAISRTDERCSADNSGMQKNQINAGLSVKMSRLNAGSMAPQEAISSMEDIKLQQAQEPESMSKSIVQNPGVWDGTLSMEDFLVASRSLCDRWNQICSVLPQWKWISCNKTETGVSSNTEGYLSLENMCHPDFGEDQVGERSIREEEEPSDNACLIVNDGCEIHIYDFHIVYSFSYRVPVLYFRGYQCDGQPLDLDSIHRDLPHYSLSILKESKWTFMTQEEHPYLRRPWYTLHPCGTSDWMRLLLNATPSGEEPGIGHYLPAWLSVVGQAVGLKIPLDL